MNFFTASIREPSFCSSYNIPVAPFSTVSNIPPFPYAITGVPADNASTGTIPKSSIQEN